VEGEVCARVRYMVNKNSSSPSRVLVVEDDPSVTRMLRFCLRAAGFDVTEASNGSEALQALDRGSADAVVLDLGLPDNLGGVVLERLRKGESMANGSPVWLVISALDREDAAKRYGPLGGRFLSKPFDPWDLVRRLEELLSASS